MCAVSMYAFMQACMGRMRVCMSVCECVSSVLYILYGVVLFGKAQISTIWLVITCIKFFFFSL